MIDGIRSEKKAQELPINVVVMVIIGIIIFGIGIAMFFKISGSSEEQIDDLESKVKNEIASLECSGDDWVCFPAAKMKQGEKKTFSVYIANRGEDAGIFSVGIVLDNVGDKKGFKNDACGSVIVNYYGGEVSVQSGHSASIPVVIQSSRISKVPCSFVKTIVLKDSSGKELAKTPIVVNVE